MTAIVGFTCFDGVLMMADTEETTSLYTKSDCDKMHHFRFGSHSVLMGGAGNAHLIECAFQELGTFLQKKGKGIKNGQQLLDKLNGFVQRFFDDTAGRYSGMEIELLIAVNLDRRQTLLFHWEGNRVRWVPPPSHDSIGSGTVQLHPMLRDFQFIMTRETALFCGIRMMFHAKRIVQGVGGKTEAIALVDDGTIVYYGTDNTQRIEELADNLEQFLNKFIYTSVSNVAPGVAKLENNVANLFSGLPERLHEYREGYKKLVPGRVIADDATTGKSSPVPASKSQKRKRPKV
jgi:hypothetical protein